MRVWRGPGPTLGMRSPRCRKELPLSRLCMQRAQRRKNNPEPRRAAHLSELLAHIRVVRREEDLHLLISTGKIHGAVRSIAAKSHRPRASTAVLSGGPRFGGPTDLAESRSRIQPVEGAEARAYQVPAVPVQMWANPGADVGQSRCGQVPVQMWADPGAAVDQSYRKQLWYAFTSFSVAICTRLVCLVPVRMRRPMDSSALCISACAHKRACTSLA